MFAKEITVWLKTNTKIVVQKVWYFVLKLGFQRSNYDTCFYCKDKGGKNSLYLVFYVDDMLLAICDKFEIEDIKQKMKSEFEMKDLGFAKKIPGM